MATTPVDRSEQATPSCKELIGFEQAMQRLSRDERFPATVYAMNTLLVQKGVYSPKNSSSSSVSSLRRTCVSDHVLVVCL
jgi:hypothetical protein